MLAIPLHLFNTQPLRHSQSSNVLCFTDTLAGQFGNPVHVTDAAYR
jgi:hypothetical protein